jgi:hypothetical protein
MKTLNVVLLVAILACMPLVIVFAAPALPAPPVEKPLKDMTIEELLTKLETGPNQTEAFDMFLNKFGPMCPHIDKLLITYRGYGLQDGLLLNFEPLPTPGLVIVPLGPAIMSHLNIKGVLVEGMTADMSKSNLQKYDIVTAVNGIDVADTGGFYKALAACPPDKEVELKIIRGGKPMIIGGILAALMAPKPPVPLEPINPPPPPPPPIDKERP